MTKYGEYLKLKRDGHFDAADQILGRETMYILNIQAAARVAKRPMPIDAATKEKRIAVETHTLALQKIRSLDKKRAKRQTRVPILKWD